MKSQGSTLLDQQEHEDARVAQPAPLVEPRATASENALTPAPVGADMFERLARDPNVPVDKLERLIALQERVMAHNAEQAFNVAFVALQRDIPTIHEKARTDKTTYAPLEDIVNTVRPILARHGFTLSHRSEWPDKSTVKVIGILTHQDGHSRESEFISAADTGPGRNAIQSLGSAVTYGKRYTTKDLLCIVTTDRDDDGEASDRRDDPKAPEGYDAWFATLEGVASEGMAVFSPAWNKSPKEFTAYLARTAPKMLAALKTRAAKVKP